MLLYSECSSLLYYCEYQPQSLATTDHTKIPCCYGTLLLLQVAVAWTCSSSEHRMTSLQAQELFEAKEMIQQLESGQVQGMEDVKRDRDALLTEKQQLEEQCQKLSRESVEPAHWVQWAADHMQWSPCYDLLSKQLLAIVQPAELVL